MMKRFLRYWKRQRLRLNLSLSLGTDKKCQGHWTKMDKVCFKNRHTETPL